MGKIIISIIVPVYNVEKELGRCLESIINQTYKNIEIILVDDGSIDRSPEICDEYAVKDKRITVIHKKNGGLSDARNDGLRISHGSYIMFVDSDDYIENDACEKLLSGITPDIDIVVGACKRIDGDKTIILRHSNIEEKKVYTAKEFTMLSIKNSEWYAPVCFNMYRRDFLFENDIFFESGICFEDTNIQIKMFGSANKIQYVDYAFYNYIIRPGTLSSLENSDKKRKMIIYIYNGWMSDIDNIKDYNYQRYLYGALIQNYLWACRAYKIKEWKLSGVDYKFSMQYALNIKEKFKILLFNYVPELFVNIKI